jgi:YD repeat-containing protein
LTEPKKREENESHSLPCQRSSLSVRIGSYCCPILSIADSLVPETSAFTYDALNRLTGVSGPLSESYTYDSEGRLASKTGMGTISYTNASHWYAAPASTNRNFSYDANGNMTGRTISGTSYTLGYDAENRLVSVSGGTTASFKYDGDGQMQSICLSDCFTIASNRIVGTVGSKTSEYIGNYFEKDGETQVFRLSNWQSQLPGCTSTMKKYYYVGSVRVAVKAGTTLSYLLGDHGVCACANTGSTSITTNNAGTKTAELRYRAVANNALRYSLKKSRFAGFPGVKTATQAARPRPPSISRVCGCANRGRANRARLGCISTKLAGIMLRI